MPGSEHDDYGYVVVHVPLPAPTAAVLAAFCQATGRPVEEVVAGAIELRLNLATKTERMALRRYG
jgi:hypothetical protein